MNFNFLPNEVSSAINKIDIKKMREIRMRVGFPISLNYENVNIFLSKDGTTLYEGMGIKCTKEMIKNIINKLTEYSVYAFNARIKKGFLTTDDGIRIGLAGECVFDKEITTIKNITSLNIRIPHDNFGVSDTVFDYLKNNNFFYNTLIISPPFYGKTSMLKDIARKINANYSYNILIIDERGEFQNIRGKRIDSIKFSDKLFAFEYGVRSMSPDIVITDELSGENDWKCVKNASNSGVKIFASCHGENLEDIKKKNNFVPYVFDRYVVLKSNNGIPGLVQGIYDNNFTKIL